MRLQVRSLASLSGLRIRCCCELWCGSQKRLGSLVAVALAWAGGYSSNSTPSLGTSMCRGRGPIKWQKDQKKKKKKDITRSSHHGPVEINLTRNREVEGSIPGLAQWVGDLALP